jgi:hypothetical protein
MKTIVLFHRLELVDLFVSVGFALQADAKIVHLAYSYDEVRRLRDLGVVGPITVFKDEVRRLYPSSSSDPKTLAEIDTLFIRQSGGAFNLNGAIQSDRGFSQLSLNEAERLTVTYYRFWSDFLGRYAADAVLHETCSLMFNFVAAMLCAERGAHYLYAIMAHGPDNGHYHLLMSGFDFTCPELERAHAALVTGALQVDEARCTAFVTKFRENFSIFLAGAFKRPPIPRLAAAAVRDWLRYLQSNPNDRILDNIDYWQAQQRVAATKIRNFWRYVHEVNFDRPVSGELFYFYPFHLEPEAVVLYHAHGLYSNQVKLIQNIAAQLPPSVRLYVKDHPHDHGYRSADDYLALKKVPNIRLLNPAISGKLVTAASQGVITLTGTAGFEALLLGKKVFTFGKTFYSAGPGVIQIRNIRDLRGALYAAEKRPPVSDAALYRYLTAYFSALHSGLTDYFAGRAKRYGIDLSHNAKIVAQSLLAAVKAFE